MSRASLDAALETPDAKRRYVRRLFGVIADRYDLITVLLSYGQDRRWKRRLASLVAARPGQRALDLACGTGDIALQLASDGARVVGLDVTPRMIELARDKAMEAADRAASAGPRGRAPPRFLVGDMMALPFSDASFDIVTAGYGIRNVPDAEAALHEIARVLRSGGRVALLDFDRPANALLRAAYLSYLTIVGSVLGWVLHRDPDTYRYIPASIRRYPGAAAIALRMRELGFGNAAHTPQLFGLMAIHHATRDAAATPRARDAARAEESHGHR